MNHAILQWRSARGFVPLILLVASGCTSTPGSSPLAMLQQNHRLLDSAKEMRAAATEPAALPRELDKALLAAYVVEPGDALLVQPADLDSPIRLPGDQTVMQDGTIDLGRYGRLVVAGKTVAAIEPDVKALVEKQTKDAGPITVRLVTRQSKVYYVLGAVNAPGAFPLSGRETVLDAILAAGGLGTQGSRRNIILTRPTPPGSCRIVLPVCYREIVQLGDTSTNYQILPGDRIFVPNKTCFEDVFFITPECPPCGRSQVPCPVTSLDCPTAHLAKTPEHISVPAPVRRPDVGIVEVSDP